MGNKCYYILEYKEDILQIFDCYGKYRKSRDVNRALWKYGHLFDRKYNKLAIVDER